MEKAAVATHQTKWLVSAKQQPEVENRLTTLDCSRLPLLTRDAVTRKSANGEEWIELEFTSGSHPGRTRLLLPDVSQMLIDNATAALTAAQAVWRDVRPGLSFPDVLDLRDVRLPGRMDILSIRPLVLLDGTIHRSGASEVACFAEAKLQSGSVERWGIVASLPEDKDTHGVLAAVTPVAAWLILTTTTNSNLMYDERSLHAARKYIQNVKWIPDVESAYQQAYELLGARDGLLLLGTQSFVGDMLRLHGETSCGIWREG